MSLLGAVEAGGSPIVIETSGIHGVHTRVHILGSVVLSLQPEACTALCIKDSTEQVSDQYRRLVLQSAMFNIVRRISTVRHSDLRRLFGVPVLVK